MIPDPSHKPIHTLTLEATIDQFQMPRHFTVQWTKQVFAGVFKD